MLPLTHRLKLLAYELETRMAYSCDLDTIREAAAGIEASRARDVGGNEGGGWFAVPKRGTLVSADHPITALNPDKVFAVHDVEMAGDRIYVRGENTMWFALPLISPAAQECGVECGLGGSSPEIAQVDQ